MNTVQKCLFGGALLGAGLSNPAIADIHIEDTVHFTSILGGDSHGSYAYGNLEVHIFDFTALSDGNVQLDMLSYGIFDSYFNSQIALFSNDGNPIPSANFIGVNQNHSGSDLNGSISNLDSFMDVFLVAGDYTVVVGAIHTTSIQAENGESFGFTESSNGTAYSGGQYEFDIYGDVALTVPAPGALALLGLGGLAATRRRR